MARHEIQPPVVSAIGFIFGFILFSTLTSSFLSFTLAVPLCYLLMGFIVYGAARFLVPPVNYLYIPLWLPAMFSKRICNLIAKR